MPSTAGTGPAYAFAKRCFDIVVASILLISLSPVLLLTAAGILLSMGPPVLFKQVRPGLRAKPFTIYKFRTMVESADALGRPLPDDLRLTPLGRILRKLSIDELPQLFNVLNGTMSLVGPRPLLMEYLDLYTPRQKLRHEVRPGITGLAQIQGRNEISWERKFELDVAYVEHRSFMLDIRILATTACALLRPRGITQPGEATARKFTGTAPDDAG